MVKVASHADVLRHFLGEGRVRSLRTSAFEAMVKAAQKILRHKYPAVHKVASDELRTHGNQCLWALSLIAALSISWCWRQKCGQEAILDT